MDKNRTIEWSKMRAEASYNLLLVWRPKTDLDKIWGKNLSDKLIRSMQKLAKSIIETSNKVHEPKTYNKIVNNPINRNRYQKTINKKLWNLDSYQT